MSERYDLSTMAPAEDMPAEEAHELAEWARQLVAPAMQIESVQVVRDQQQHGSLILRGRLLRPSEELFPDWLAAFNRRGYTPMLRHDLEGGSDRVALHVLKGTAPKSKSRPLFNLALLVITIISTLFVGSLYSPAAAEVESLTELLSPRLLLAGWPYAATLLGILLAHEFGHYFAARYHRVAVSLPFFIPLPIPGGFGTLGAFIRLKEPVPDRRKLFDIGVAGPLAGLVLAVPLLILGLRASPVIVPEPVAGAWLEGNSIFYFFAKYWIFGKALPNALTGEDVIMNQVTLAAWFGLLVTALNLLPVGQLDGGHTVFAMFGGGARYINLTTASLMAVLAVAGLAPLQRRFPVLESIGFFGWFLWLGLIFFVIGPFHPPALDDVTRLDLRRRVVGYLVILIFILIFVPVPLRPIG